MINMINRYTLHRVLRRTPSTTRPFLKSLIIGFAGLCFCVDPLQARPIRRADQQTLDACMLFSDSLSSSLDNADTLHDVFVTANSKIRDIKSASPRYTLDNTNFSRLGVTDIADAVHRLPGITLRDYGGAGGMKTVSVRGMGAQNTGVSYDGIALSDCQTGQIDLQRYTMEGVKSMQLNVAGNDDIFMPARNASSSALLSITSLDNTDLYSPTRCKAQLALGAWGYTNPMVQVRTSWHERLAFSATADYVYAENDYPFTIPNASTSMHKRRTNSMMNQWHGETSLLWKVNDRNRLTAKLYYYDNDRQLPGPVHYYTEETSETLHDRNAFAQARWLATLNDNLQLMVNGKFNWTSSDYQIGKPSGGITDSQYWQREAYASAALLYNPIHNLSLNYSADYVMNNMNSSLSVASKPCRHSILQAAAAKVCISRFTLLARGIYSVYLNDSHAATAANGLPSGINAQTESAPDEHNLVPSLSLSYRPFLQEEFYIRASWKKIFRMPTFNELYYYHLGNPMLSPEKTNQWNIGLTWQSDRTRPFGATLTADGYLNTVTDKIVSIPYNMFVWRTVNIGKVKIYGIDVTADMSFTLISRHTIGLTANYSYQRAKNETFQGKFYGLQIAYTPEYSGSATLYWTNPWVNLSATADGMSRRWATNEHNPSTDIPGFVEYSLTAYRSHKAFGCTFTLSASVINITDKQYEIVRRYPMPGRGWKLNFTIEH